MKCLGRSGLLASLVLAVAVAIAACGDDDSSSSGGGTGAVPAKSVAVAPPASGCGSYSVPAVKDPDGLVASLPEDLQANYNGYPSDVTKSYWENWKPDHGPPYRVGVQWAQLANDFQINVTDSLKAALKKNPDVGEVTFQSTGDNINVTAQLQQLNAMITSKPDIIILQQLQPDAMIPTINRAGKAGIPVVVIVDSVESKYAVNVQYNVRNVPAQVASMTVRQMAGKGNVLKVHAIPGISVDTHAMEGFDAVLKNCPNIKVAGDVYGNFVNVASKSETLKYLATHPEKIDGALQTAGMTAGVISAFEQTGRPVPSVADISSTKGSLGYWDDNFDSYRGAAAPSPELSMGVTLAGVAGGMLDGRGVRFSDIVGTFPLVSDSNLDQFVEDDWTLRTPDDPLGTADAFLSPAQLDEFFTNPSAGK